MARLYRLFVWARCGGGPFWCAVWVGRLGRPFWCAVRRAGCIGGCMPRSGGLPEVSVWVILKAKHPIRDGHDGLTTCRQREKGHFWSRNKVPNGSLTFLSAVHLIKSLRKAFFLSEPFASKPQNAKALKDSAEAGEAYGESFIIS